MTDHTHNPYDIGAAEDTHTHYVSEVNGAASTDALSDLQKRVQELETRLEAERAVATAVADGENTIALLVQALRNRAVTTGNQELAGELRLLASEIQALGMRR